jgi:CheY-like chemotaxis protein
LDYANTPLGTRRILIADDTVSSRDLLRSILEANGHVVEEALDGQQVLETIEAFGPHLVILDLHMPRLDGYSTAIALRQIPVFQRMPIVALTAAITQTAPERIAEAGFSTYLVKPIRPSSLRQCVTDLLRERDA